MPRQCTIMNDVIMREVFYQYLAVLPVVATSSKEITIDDEGDPGISFIENREKLRQFI